MKDYTRYTSKDGATLTMSQWGGSPAELGLYRKLAEIESKIENGTLIELPCKVGDTIFVSYGVCVDEWEVVSIQIFDFDILFRLGHKGTDDYNSQYLSELGEMWFLTKPEAESKLRELKEKEDENIG